MSTSDGTFGCWLMRRITRGCWLDNKLSQARDSRCDLVFLDTRSRARFDSFGCRYQTRAVAANVINGSVLTTTNQVVHALVSSQISADRIGAVQRMQSTVTSKTFQALDR
jgi:hypothetical protein